VNDGALVWRQFGKGFRQLRTKRLLIRIVGRREGRERFGGELLALPVARAATPHQVNRRVVSEADEEGALVPRGAEQFGPSGELRENLLKHVVSVILVAGEVQQEGEQRLGVVVVQPCEVGRHRSYLNDARGRMICLSKCVERNGAIIRISEFDKTASLDSRL
jgi:hypothetical protein